MLNKGGRGQRAGVRVQKGRGRMTDRRRRQKKITMGMKIESFRDLVVYQKAFDLQQQIFAITKSFPKEKSCTL